MNNLFKKYWQLFAIALIIIAFDQWTKYLVRTTLAIGESWYPIEVLAPFLRVVHWNNSGAAFGILQGYNPVFMALAVVVSGAIIYYYPRVPLEDKLIRFALGLQLGGALGNLIDRILIGQVTDFVSVGSFAVFNVADSGISVGVAILLLGIYLNEQRGKKEKLIEAEQSGASKENEGDGIA